MANANLSQQEIIAKIQKLYALAQSDNENEARLAMQKAQELQARYNVSVEELSVEQEPEVKSEAVDSPDTKTLNSFFKLLANRLASHYRVKVYIRERYHNYTREVKLMIVGLPVDVEVFKQSLYFAYSAMRKLATTFVRQLPNYYSRSDKTRMKNDYYMGFIHGCDQALTQNETEKALMIVTPQAVVKYINNLSLRGSSKCSVSRAWSDEAQRAGYNDGVASMRNSGANRLTE